MRLVSPVFGKEMVTLARKKRHFFARALLLGVLLVTISVVWYGLSVEIRRRGFADLSHVGRRLFEVFVTTQLFAVVILVPALTAPVIAAEKDRDTLGLLLMSNLGRGNILLDKLLSCICLIVLLLLSGLPLCLALLAFGGITPAQIVTAYTSVFGTVLFCSGVGLYFSTVSRKMHTALLATYVLLACYWFGIILVAGSSAWRWSAGLRLWSVTLCLLPTPFHRLWAPSSAFSFLGWCVLVFAFCFAVCYRLLPKMVGNRRRQAVKRLSDRMNVFFARINFTRVVLFDEDRALGRNAILWKEAHKRFFCSTPFLIRATWVLLALSVLILRLTSCRLVTWLVLVGLVLLGVLSLVSAATAFTGEREKRSFEVLLSSPLRARSIVMAKFVGVLRLLVPILVCTAVWRAASDWLYIYDPRRPWPVWTDLLMVVVAYVPMLIVIGLHAGLQRRRGSSALLQAFVVVVVWSLIPFGLHVIDIFNWADVSQELYESVFSMAPLWAAALGMHRSLNPWSCMSIVPCWIGLLALLVANFDRLVGRR